MSTVSNSVMQASPYPESSPVNTALYRGDERRAHKLERAEASFLDATVGGRGSLRSILKQVEAVASTITAVWMTGETGPVKEVSAGAIHGLGPRRNRNLVKVNCAAM